LGYGEVNRGKEELAMSRDEDINDQAKADWEFTRRAQEYMARLRQQWKNARLAGQQHLPDANQPEPPEETPQEE
jgi:hypothetical protein